jgi:hypothetical protein
MKIDTISSTEDANFGMTIIEFMVEEFHNLLMGDNVIAEIEISCNETWDIFFVNYVPL